MEFFLDTAIIEEIKKGNEWGILDGVTTNPSLVQKSGLLDFPKLVKEIATEVKGPVSAEVTAVNANEMVKEGLELAKIAKNVYVKVPMTPEGIKAIVELKKHHIKINCTLIFSANQALVAAKAGADFVSPFIGRLDDAGQDGMELIAEIRQIFDNYKIETKILAASMRHTIHVKDAALAGADIATMPFSVMEALFKHPLTDVGLKKFLDDWAKIPKK